MALNVTVTAANGASQVLTVPAPIVNTPVPPPAGVSLSKFTDLTLVFLQHTSVTPKTVSPEFSIVDTIHGSGFQFVIDDTADVTPWDANMKCVLAKAVNNKNPVVMNGTQAWDFWIYIPQQPIVTSWNGGVLWEFHTPGNSSGHNLCLDNTGRGPGGKPSFRWIFEGGSTVFGPNVVFDTWHHVHIDIRWSLGNDGFCKMYMDDVLMQNHINVPTVYAADGGTPFLQFGWYCDIGAKLNVPSVGKNQITIAGITVTNS